jgi:hypothetical protein
MNGLTHYNAHNRAPFGTQDISRDARRNFKLLLGLSHDLTRWKQEGVITAQQFEELLQSAVAAYVDAELSPRLDRQWQRAWRRVFH